MKTNTSAQSRRVILMGHCGGDPELKLIQSGRALANF